MVHIKIQKYSILFGDILILHLTFERNDHMTMNDYTQFIESLYEKAGTRHPSKIQIIKLYMEHLNALTEQEVSFIAMAEIVRQEQLRFEPDLTLAEAAESINAVLRKRNVQFAFLMAIQNDLMTQFKLALEPLESILFEDRGTFGGDEQMALEISNLYGTIGYTNFGYLDREKQGFIKELDQLGKTRDDITTTFIDDILSAIVSAAEARVAHIRDHGHDDEPYIDVIDIKSLKF